MSMRTECSGVCPERKISQRSVKERGETIVYINWIPVPEEHDIGMAVLLSGRKGGVRCCGRHSGCGRSYEVGTVDSSFILTIMLSMVFEFSSPTSAVLATTSIC